jgi:hypothetical protein
VDALVKELVGSRKRMLLVQAVSQHRQKRNSDAVTSLSNLISAYRWGRFGTAFDRAFDRIPSRL